MTLKTVADHLEKTETDFASGNERDLLRELRRLRLEIARHLLQTTGTV